MICQSQGSLKQEANWFYISTDNDGNVKWYPDLKISWKEKVAPIKSLIDLQILD